MSTGNRTLRLVLGDQLSPGLSALRDADRAGDVVLMAEVMGEATYVRHHPKKITLVFAAMRHFAEALREDGFTVDYVRLEDEGNTGDLGAEVARAVARHGGTRVVATFPGEWRVWSAMKRWRAALEVPVEILSDDRFLIGPRDFADWAEGRKTLRMEHFYRMMRRRHGVLVDADGEPEGGRWNFDRENRKALPDDLDPPAIEDIAPDATTREVLDLVARRFGDHFGDLEPFGYAVTAADAERLFEAFVAERLPRFGDYQDAMRAGSDTLFHAVVSMYLNIGLLDPMRMIRRVEHAYHDGAAPLNAVEGFIRQILGWREYIRGIYWLHMPDYDERNFLDAHRDLPAFYWTGDTDMACLAATIGQTRRLAYAHHIQRLMVTGNFGLLIGVEPRQLDDWYLEVYADAFEWVELPNTHGMVQFADGGLLASKPYAASGAYIDRMSDYCRGCAYDVRKKTGAGACPFNLLYWDFLDRNRAKLEGNHRLGMIYRSYDRMKPERRKAIAEGAAAFLEKLDAGERV